MAYRVNARFKDGSTNGPLADVVAAPPPPYGGTILITRNGRPVPFLVTAIWTPARKAQGPWTEGLVMIEAREI